MLDPSCCPPRGVRESPFRTPPPFRKSVSFASQPPKTPLSCKGRASGCEDVASWCQGVAKASKKSARRFQNGVKIAVWAPLLIFYRNWPTVSWTQYLLYILYIGPPKATLFFDPWATQNMSKHRAVLSTLPQPWKRRPCGPQKAVGRFLRPPKMPYGLQNDSPESSPIATRRQPLPHKRQKVPTGLQIPPLWVDLRRKRASGEHRLPGERPILAGFHFSPIVLCRKALHPFHLGRSGHGQI